MDIIERLKELRDNNPNFARVIEKEFPEILNKEPYMESNQTVLFMKEQYSLSLYCLFYEDGYFKIKNLKNNAEWSTKAKAIESLPHSYLRVCDFEEMIKASGTGVGNIRIVKAGRLKQLHSELFNQ